MSGSLLRDIGSGSNYLCMPKQPKYGKYNSAKNSESGQIDGVTYGNSYSKVDMYMTNKIINCAVCQVSKKSETLMIPASNICPPDWSLEYQGYVAAQRHTDSTRTMYICLEGTYNSKRAGNSRSGMLNKVTVPKCDILPCGNNQFKSQIDLSCVVCSK